VKADVHVTVLVENTVYREGLLAEHGLSLWIEYEGRTILFDTGQTNILVQNALALGKDITCAHTVVLSHGHYDHVGGMGALLKLAPSVSVHCHQKAIQPKYRYQDHSLREIGMRSDLRAQLLQSCRSRRTTYTNQATDIAPGVTVTGTIPRKHSFENAEPGFYLDKEHAITDPLEDDQALCFDADRGIVVVLGCAHAGVVNTLDYIQELFADRRIYAVIGGMHLRGATSNRLTQTLDALDRMEIQIIAPGHCTGAHAISEFQKQFASRCIPLTAGLSIDL
jgi:7,8-dihydropterin-6-yl-methyl-4-(beta-D-ribofuranosyl)aminobenzene 5'-phosphate synthase